MSYVSYYVVADRGLYPVKGDIQLCIVDLIDVGEGGNIDEES